MKMKSLIAIPFLAASLLMVPATSFAGEVTGNGKETGMRGHAKSECGFSGLEDEAASPIRTQTPHSVWLGPGPGVVYPPPGTPGVACNPTHAED